MPARSSSRAGRSTSRGPSRHAQAGIETIYQDLALAGNLDVSANIFLGREVKKRHLLGAVKTLDEKAMRGESDAILQRLGIKIPRCAWRSRSSPAGSGRR